MWARGSNPDELVVVVAYGVEGKAIKALPARKSPYVTAEFSPGLVDHGGSVDHGEGVFSKI